jgi:hypothetical protein
MTKNHIADYEGACVDNHNSNARVAESALTAQMVWASLAALWNLTGVALIAAGQRAPGPTASIAAAAVLIVIVVALPLLSRRSRLLYLVLSALAGLMALFAVVSAFTSDAALWPSDFWRYAGATLNTVGVFATFVAIINAVSSRE